MLVVTTPHLPGREITDVYGMVSGEAILGANIVKQSGSMLMVTASGTAVRFR
jgi:uncharacterized protein YbjQ (UPF0145 family)